MLRLIVILVIAMILCLWFFYANSQCKITKYYIKSETCISSFTKELLESVSSIKKTETIDKDTLVLLSNYDIGKQEIDDIKNFTPSFVSGFSHMDTLVAKDGLYDVIRTVVPDKVHQLLPKSYILGKDEQLFLKEKQDNKIYVIKKNIQRQEGITIVKGASIKTINDLNELYKDNNVIIQEYLDNPYLISGLKINLRVYLLVISVNSKTKAYIYDNGFIYYGQKKYNKESTNPEEAITTGLQKDRRVYEENPLTIKDLETVIGVSNYSVLTGNIKILMKNVLRVYKNILKSPKSSSSYQIFGCDIQPDTSLDVKLIEINKNPSLDFKDERDGILKKNLQINIFKKIGIDLTSYNDDTFIKLEI